MRSFFSSCVLDLYSEFELELECITSSCLLIPISSCLCIFFG